MDWEKFSKEELQDAINKFVDKILISWDEEKKEHSINIKFKLPLVDDKFDYNDPNNKSKGYKVTEGKSDILGKIPVTPRGKKSAYPQNYSTVTDFAKFLG